MNPFVARSVVGDPRLHRRHRTICRGGGPLCHRWLARPEGLEPPTDRVETGCSIH